MEGGVMTKIGGALVKPALKGMQGKLDYSKAGGAVVLGVNAPVVKTHGSAKAEAVSNTFAQIHQMVANELVPSIKEYVAANIEDLSAKTLEEPKEN
jgi:glycerol-3-phosphate acyltransferase PlsX